jgi:hypothetical protein
MTTRSIILLAAIAIIMIATIIVDAWIRKQRIDPAQAKKFNMKKKHSGIGMIGFDKNRKVEGYIYELNFSYAVLKKENGMLSQVSFQSLKEIEE